MNKICSNESEQLCDIAIDWLRTLQLCHEQSMIMGNPGSLCVTRDITQGNYREHMRWNLGLKCLHSKVYYEGKSMKTTFPKN